MKKERISDVSQVVDDMVHTREYKIFLFLLTASLGGFWIGIYLMQTDLLLSFIVFVVCANLLATIIMILHVLILAELIVIEKEVLSILGRIQEKLIEYKKR